MTQHNTTSHSYWWANYVMELASMHPASKLDQIFNITSIRDRKSRKWNSSFESNLIWATTKHCLQRKLQGTPRQITAKIVAFPQCHWASASKKQTELAKPCLEERRTTPSKIKLKHTLAQINSTHKYFKKHIIAQIKSILRTTADIAFLFSSQSMQHAWHP